MRHRRGRGCWSGVSEWGGLSIPAPQPGTWTQPCPRFLPPGFQEARLSVVKTDSGLNGFWVGGGNSEVVGER